MGGILQVDGGGIAADDGTKAVILGLTKIGWARLVAGGCGAAVACRGR